MLQWGTGRPDARSCWVRIVLLGAPGSGKGTQGERLAARLGVPHVASGELLRAQIEARTPLGIEVAERIARGDLVPDDAIVEIRAQAERAYELAQPVGIDAQAAVYLSLDDDIARARLAGRADGGRPDDANASVIEHRLQVFHDNMRPILDYYAERGILVTVDAARSVDEVTEAILAALAAVKQ
jgi:adenylate kinase